MKKQILIMCDSDFIGNASGIYTFVKYCSKLFNDLNYKVSILTDKKCSNFSEEILSMDIDCIYYTGKIENSEMLNKGITYSYLEIQDQLTSKLFKAGLEEYLSKGNEPSLIIANSYSTTKALSEVNCNFRQITYTHIGDLLDEHKKNMYDFDDEITQKYLALYKDSNIHIGTQCLGVKEKLVDMLDIAEDRITVLSEPYYILRDILDLGIEKDGIIIISGNYIRKNYDKMLQLIGRLKLPVTIVCGNVKHGHDNIYDLLHKYGIVKYRIVENICNDYIHTLIKQHKLMMHLSHIEVFPYALLEGLTHIPAVINGNAIWGKSFLDDATKIDILNIEESCNIINEIYQSDKKTTFDILEYQVKTDKQWRNFLNGK